MSPGDPRPAPPPPLHAYHPLVVSEDFLTDEDCRQATLAAFQSPEDWNRYLTQEELAQLETELKAIDERTSPYFHFVGEHPARWEKRSEFARRGMFRAYARRKYANGHHYLYADGVPFHREGEGSAVCLTS